mmetsp:Transcript_33713/g.86452  ORF Transcript_33713/g.86452 Transcript_33713/m.86452 type:complete len:299 (-) Transcript_33713:1330-2226(-)|eukprot:CAMPEP_0113881546 /NCGR_PEP_ID=MMETSP0780_2-20120614/8438_1 /TAXON_ID=652834 /ORGANISM="Palpitomonas bilix" /LENGTH=298 /DNA_ID=CAMNT_0000868419 /DNA_START=107 /DNA_END=1003 /DNA_ORIENTATION=- /assembly_acc=CAM_ASM_000599
MGASQTREAERIDGPIEPAPAPAVEAFAPSTPVGIDQSDASLLPTYFRWDGPGDRVYLMGSFDGWSQKLPLRRSSGDLVYSINLPPGEYQYKFVVDDEYRVSQAEPLSKAKDGTLVNVITVEASVSTEPKQADKLSSSPPSSYAQDAPRDAFSKEPPLLPRHLHYPLLNCNPPPKAADLSLLPIPPHVCLGRAYWTKGAKNPSGNYGAILLSTTYRYRQKYVTQIVYTPPSTTLSVHSVETDQSGSERDSHNSGSRGKKGVRFGGMEEGESRPKSARKDVNFGNDPLAHGDRIAQFYS